MPGEAHLVRDHDHRHALAGQRGHHLEHLADHRGRARWSARRRAVPSAAWPAPGRSRPAAADRRRAGPGIFSAWLAMPTRSSSARWPRSRTTADFSLRTLVGPSMTFCRIVLWANRLKDWKDHADLAAQPGQRAALGRQGLAVERDRPGVDRSSRLIDRHSVDLPEPDGPITTTTSPRATEGSRRRARAGGRTIC